MANVIRIQKDDLLQIFKEGVQEVIDTIFWIEKICVDPETTIECIKQRLENKSGEHYIEIDDEGITIDDESLSTFFTNYNVPHTVHSSYDLIKQ